jgi:glycine cleavage system H lipoate-binding protein
MVFALVVATFLALVAGDWFLSRRRQRISVEERLIAESEHLRADAAFLHPGMAWARGPSGRALTVGASEFAVDFVGKLGRIELPRVGQRLLDGDAAVTLVSEHGRRLALPTPVEGRVLAVNADPSSDPTGWMLRVRPRGRGGNPWEVLLQGKAARHWVDEARALVLSHLAPGVGLLAHDGGVWTRAWGELLDDRTWAEVKRELFPEGPRA